MISESVLRTRSLPRLAVSAAQDSAKLARRMTWQASKQSYLIAALLASRRRRDDCYRAYAYFRWVDDVVDEQAQTRPERMRFIQRQRDLVERTYRREPLPRLAPEEQMIVDLIRSHGGGLQRYIHNFMAVIEFDAARKGQTINAAALGWYVETLASAVTDAIEYFIGDGYDYPDSPERTLAPSAAHLAHMLRDLVEDLQEGFLNIPREYMELQRMQLWELDSLPMRMWVMDRIRLAREYFSRGSRYLNALDHLPSKLAGAWYIQRFETVLDSIECEGYVLRSAYPERRSAAAWLGMAWVGITVVAQHAARNLRAASHREPAVQAPTQT